MIIFLAEIAFGVLIYFQEAPYPNVIRDSVEATVTKKYHNNSTATTQTFDLIQEGVSQSVISGGCEKSQVRQCFGTADFLSWRVYESTVQKPKHCLTKLESSYCLWSLRVFVEGGGEKISPAAESVDILKAIDYDQLDRDCDCEVCSLLCIGISGSRKERSQADRRDDDKKGGQTQTPSLPRFSALGVLSVSGGRGRSRCVAVFTTASHRSLSCLRIRIDPGSMTDFDFMP